ncbi:hypothetical protein QOT17_016616 [Balamuthia mandrillaris]
MRTCWSEEESTVQNISPPSTSCDDLDTLLQRMELIKYRPGSTAMQPLLTGVIRTTYLTLKDNFST